MCAFCRFPPQVGEICYSDLIMRDAGETRPAAVDKSEERGKLMEEGFDIVAGFGDQWSDLLGPNSTPYLIKIPNPFYYVA